jgi:hypothetical protein
VWLLEEEKKSMKKQNEKKQGFLLYKSHEASIDLIINKKFMSLALALSI